MLRVSIIRRYWGWMGLCSGLLTAPPGIFAQGSFCDLVVEACPSQFANTVITVPKSTVALSARMPFCPETVFVAQPTVTPPSIMFIIDNSGSMSNGNNNNGNDPNEERFKQTIAMLDDIYAASPLTRVGITSFSRRLQYDSRDPHLLRPAFPNTADFDAYVPLTRLDTSINGVLGIDTLKAMLKHDNGGSLTHGTRRPATRTVNPDVPDPNNYRDGTDITLGFQSALTAMQASPSSKDLQFIIFISDGEPAAVDSLRRDLMNQFKAGTNTPTTFTIFLNRNDDTTSAGYIATKEMTANIKANGYSTSNPKSAIWLVDEPRTELQVLLRSLLSTISTPVNTSAQTATISSGGVTQTSASPQGGNFLFQKRIPLQADRTVVSFEVNYSYTDNSKTPPVVSTKLVTYTLTVQRTGAENPAGTRNACYDAPVIDLLAGNRVLTQVESDQNPIQVRVTQPAGQTCVGCTAVLASKQGPDTEIIPLTAAGNIATGTFEHEVATSAIPRDLKLQHLALNDSIVVNFQNPEVPLEIVRRAFRYNDTKTVLQIGYHNDVATTKSTEAGIPEGTQFILAGAPTLKVEQSGGDANCCAAWPTPNFGNAGDSSRFVGLKLTATREFSAEIRIFDNLGTLVNKTSFKVPKAEFLKLPYDAVSKTRSVRFVWNGRALDGSRAGTGAYIMLGEIKLATEAGVAEDKVTTVLRRRVGLIRGD